MKLSSVTVLKLFDAFNHHITFNNDEGITLMLGLNGVGKTIILKMIKSFFDKNLNDFSDYYFQSIIFDFGLDGKITLVKSPSTDEYLDTLTIYRGENTSALEDEEFLLLDTEDQNISKFQLKLYSKDFRHNIRIKDEYYWSRRRIREMSSRQMDLFDNPHDINYAIAKHIPSSVELVSPDTWIDKTDGRVYSTKDLINRYAKYIPKEIKELFNYPIWLQDSMDACKVKFIETQRLLNKIDSDEGKYKSAVLDYSRALAEIIKNTKAEASDLAAKLDRTFPNRLIERLGNTSEDLQSGEKETQDSLNDLNKKREFLSSVGLIDATDEHIKPIPDVVSGTSRGVLRSVLNVYTEDSNSKLNTYNTLAKKIDILVNVINKRFIYKRVSIDRNKGFLFKSTITENEIPLSGLSSGEQHELVLFYQLLFTTDQYNLLLIDEPEISLHISWQKKFIDDLREVIKVNKLDVIIATHSPDIIGNHWDLTVDMQGA